MATINSSAEHARGCGYRKPGGLYLVAGALSRPCGKLPIPLTVCPCCGSGIKPARGWTWIESKLVKDAPCSLVDCVGCYPFDGKVEIFGLIWIGTKFYPTAQSFSKEAAAMGVSRRIKSIPREFKLGETWVLLAHRYAIPAKSKDESDIPGIFTAFKPTRIEYVIREDDSDEKLESLEKRGITLVNVFPIHEQKEIKTFKNE